MKEEKERYCRKCELTLPIQFFFKGGQKRYCCRKHFYLMQHQCKSAAAKKKTNSNDNLKAVIYYARRLAKKVFSGYDLSVTCQEAKVALQNNLCIVPLDPSKPLTIQNMHMCSPAHRRLLRRLWLVTRPNTDIYLSVCS